MCKKEKDTNIDYSQMKLKYEKGILHIRYIIAIAIIIAVIGIAVGTGDNCVFSGEISMASSVSSIILSVVAIFMSISGENKNSVVQGEVLSASTKLATSVLEFESIANMLSVKMQELEKHTKDMHEKIDNMSFGQQNDQDVNNKFTIAEIIKIYKALCADLSLRKHINWVLEYVLVVLSKDDSVQHIQHSEVMEYLKEIEVLKDEQIWVHTVWGIAIVFSRIGINYNNKEEAKLLLKEVHAIMEQNNTEVILASHYKYKN